MLNQVIIVGRLVDTPTVEEDGEKKISNIVVAVPRSYKNSDGEYDTDFIDVELWDGVARSTADYCKKGDIIGVKGRIKVDSNDDNGITIKATKIVAEKITFLSSKKEDE